MRFQPVSTLLELKRKITKMKKMSVIIGLFFLTFSACERVLDPGNEINSKGIFYSADGNIYRMDYDGSNVTQITFEEKDCNNPQISSDGTLLYYDVQANINRIPSGGLMYDFSIINIMKLANKELVEISGENDWCSNASLSPDKKLVVFCSQTDGHGADIFTADINGKNLTQITNGYYNRYPKFTPNGRQIIFESSRDNKDNLFIADLDGKNLRQLTDSEWNVNAVFSPNGDKIVWETYWDIWMMDIDGSNKINLTNDEKFFDRVPSYSNNGSKLVFIAENLRSASSNDRTYEIHILDLLTNERHEIVKTGQNFEPMFFPNDDKILFSRYENDYHFYLYNVNPDGSDLKRLVRGGNAAIH
ncbi:MAG: TolB family protein [Gammaproteobacteria bacterium]|nr:TolB family protein [Gammaproteobacteria bacterium]